ncbi:MAG: hypothetical protein HRU40_08455 [Saprospiraceae bacterium]|nr:hypothetical protein [Saprospiraceae bacterium]
MKTKKLVLISFLFLFVVSIGSFVYLNSVDPVVNNVAAEQQSPSLEDGETIVLPDVQLIERFLESSKQIIYLY